MRIKNFSVDIDDLHSIELAINQLRSAAGSLRPKSEKQEQRERFLAATSIWESDIAAVYSEMEMSSDRKFYVYVHCDSAKPIRAGVNPVSTFLASLGVPWLPFYVGKGTGDRAFDLNRNGLHRKMKQRILECGSAVVPVVVKNDLTELEALVYESKLIDILGVSGKSGRLANNDEGILADKRRAMYSKDLAVLSSYHAHVGGGCAAH